MDHINGQQKERHMTEIGKCLITTWAGAPLAIWLGGGLILSVFLLTIIILCVRKIRVEWKTRKRLLLIETDNSARGETQKPSQFVPNKLKRITQTK